MKSRTKITDGKEPEVFVAPSRSVPSPCRCADHSTPWRHDVCPARAQLGSVWPCPACQGTAWPGSTGLGTARPGSAWLGRGAGHSVLTEGSFPVPLPQTPFSSWKIRMPTQATGAAQRCSVCRWAWKEVTEFRMGWMAGHLLKSQIASAGMDAAPFVSRV